MKLFEWGEKRYARGIARSMIKSYVLFKDHHQELSEYELIKIVLATRPGEPAKSLLAEINDLVFFNSIGGNLLEIIFILVRMEYMEYMKGVLDKESSETNLVFRKVILEEMEGLR